MNSNPKISVIVPVYNNAKYLRKCLDTLVLQTYDNLEIICINDGSTDESLSILNEYSAKDGRIIVLSQENAGAAAARNRGLALASGDYVSCIDGDDWVFLTLYQTFVNAIEKAGQELDIWMFNVAAYEEGKNDVVCRTFFNKIDWNNHKSDDTIHTFDDCVRPFTRNLSAANKIYRKAFLDEFDITFAAGLKYEDQVFSIKTFLRARTIMFTEDVFYKYRNFSAGTATTVVGEKVFDIFKVVDLIEQEINSLNVYEAYKYAFFQYKYTIFASHYKYCPAHLRDRYYNEMKRRLLEAAGRNIDLNIAQRLRNFKIYEVVKANNRAGFDKFVQNVITTAKSN